MCDPVSPNPGSSRDGDSLVPFLRSLFGLSFVRLRLNPSPLLSRCRSLGCRSWVGTPRLLQGALRLLSHLLSLLLSLLGRLSVASGVASSFASAVTPRWSLLLLPLLSLLNPGVSFGRCRSTRRLRLLLRFLLLSLFLWLLFSLLLLRFLRLLLSLLNLLALLALSPGGGGGGG